VRVDAVKSAQVNDARLVYELIGSGEPLLLIHGSNLAIGLSPLADALARQAPGLGLVRYHRRGMGGSTAVDGSSSVGQDASDALGLLDCLGMPSAHVLGYSYGGVVALEAALMAPSRIRSLILLEPILADVPSGAAFLAALAPVLRRYADGDMAGAVAATFQSLGGDRWDDLIATAGPNALEMAFRDAPAFYRAELPALNAWTLDSTRAAGLHSPVLSVLGEDSGQFFVEGRRQLHERFPHCFDADIPNVNHLLYLQAPQRIAMEVASFLAGDGSLSAEGSGRLCG
jgi:pimeloyl-ACP methyl ester carboxylesterase